MREIATQDEISPLFWSASTNYPPVALIENVFVESSCEANS